MIIIRDECALCGQYIDITCWREDGNPDANAGEIWRLNVHGMFAGNMEPPCPGSMLTAKAARHLASLDVPNPNTTADNRPIRRL